jgi:hypothetical protein
MTTPPVGPGPFLLSGEEEGDNLSEESGEDALPSLMLSPRRLSTEGDLRG